MSKDDVRIAIRWTLATVAIASGADLVLWLLLWSPSAQAGEIQREQLVELYGLAYAGAGIGVPERPPRVYRVSRATMSEMVCHADCDIRAAQFADAVFLVDDIDPDDAFDKSIVVHEFVHYVQWVYRGRAVGCDEKRRREVQAFMIQSNALEHAGLRFPVPELPLCSEPESDRLPAFKGTGNTNATDRAF
jgi:hypothetical protein